MNPTITESVVNIFIAADADLNYVSADSSESLLIIYKKHCQ